MSKKEKKKSTFWKDFKAFISRGNIVDLAVGLVIGAAFTAIVNSLVNDIIKPLIALLVNGDFSELVVVLRDAVYDSDGVTVLQEAITLNYGNLIMAILTFLIDAFVIFTVLRIVTKARNRLREEGQKLREKLAKAEEAKEDAEAAAQAAQAAADSAQAESAAVAAQAESAAKSAADAAACLPAEQSSPAVEQLLTEIRDLLKEQKESGAKGGEKKE